ncbi:MAG TPA: hypothetical protein VJ781_06350 [Pyrinomonadaceae bacterium]|nr:hypothetical protein [Pyrinomonadaceae bacterium]
MIEQVPAYVSITFLITSFVTVAIFVTAVLRAGTNSIAAKVLLFILPAWMIFQAVLASGGFFLNTDAVPPRLFLFGPLPVLLFIIIYFVFARESVIEKLPLAHLTLIHTIRIPVELVLAWLFAAGMVPEIMTYHGSNFDILSGITAPIVYFVAFRGGRVNTKLLAAWNVFALVLLINIVATAVLCVPSPIQKLAFDQPNIALFYFPYIWLPTVIVPIVLFCHLASLWKIFRAKV